MKAIGGEKARKWRRRVAKAAVRNDKYVRTLKFPLEPAEGVSLDFDKFAELYDRTQGLGKGTLTGLLCATHLSGFHLFGSASETELFRNEKRLPLKEFQSTWEADFLCSPNDLSPSSLISYLSRGRRNLGKEADFTPAKIADELYRMVTGKLPDKEKEINEKVFKFLSFFGNEVCSDFISWPELNSGVGKALRIFDASSATLGLSLPELESAFSKIESLTPEKSSIDFDVNLPVLPLNELDETALHAVVAQKLRWLKQTTGKPTKKLKTVLQKTISDRNALSWLFGSGYLYWRESSLDKLVEEYGASTKHKQKIESLKEWFDAIPEESLFGHKSYSKFRSELCGKIDSWVANYLSRLEELNELIDKINIDYQLPKLLKEAVCADLFSGISLTAEQLENITKNIAGGAKSSKASLDVLLGETDALPTEADISVIDEFSSKIDGLFGLFEILSNRIEQEKNFEGSKIKGLEDVELKMPPWLKSLPKVNRVSGGIPKVREELDDIVAGFNKYTELYQEHVAAIQDWLGKSKETLDPLAELAKKELELLKKHSNDKKEHGKANIQGRRKLLNAISRIAVSGTDETKIIVKEQLLSCGISRKDLNKLIDNNQGSLYRNPFSRGRHEAYGVSEGIVSGLDMLAFIKKIASELEEQKNEYADLKHYRDWLKMESLYNTTGLYCIPEQVPASLANKESIEEHLTIPKTILPLITQSTISRGLLIRIINLYQSEISGALSQLFRESFIVKTKFQRVDFNELLYTPKEVEWNPPQQYLTSKKPLGELLRNISSDKEGKSGTIRFHENSSELIKENIKKQSWPVDGFATLLTQAPHDWYVDLNINDCNSKKEIKGYRVGKKGLINKECVLTTPFRLIGASSFKNKLDAWVQYKNIKIGEHNLIVCQEYSQKTIYEDGKLSAEIKPIKTSTELAVTISEEKIEVETSFNPIQETVIGIDLGEAGIGYAVFDAQEISKLNANTIEPICSGAIAIPSIRNLIKRVNHYRNKTQPKQKFQQRFNNSLQMLRENAIGDVCHAIDNLSMKHKGMPVLESSVRNLATGANQLKLIYDRILNIYIYSDIDAHKSERKHHWCGSERWIHPIILKQERKQNAKGEWVSTGKHAPLNHFPAVSVHPAGTSQVCSSCKRNPYELIASIGGNGAGKSIVVEAGGKVTIGEDMLLLKSKINPKQSSVERHREIKKHRQLKKNTPFSYPAEQGKISVKELMKHVSKQLRQPQESTRSRDTTQSVYQCVFKDCGNRMHADENAGINIVRKWALRNVYICDKK